MSRRRVFETLLPVDRADLERALTKIIKAPQSDPHFENLAIAAVLIVLDDGPAKATRNLLSAPCSMAALS
jgi:hypothetical protein